MSYPLSGGSHHGMSSQRATIGYCESTCFDQVTINQTFASVVNANLEARAGAALPTSALLVSPYVRLSLVVLRHIGVTA